MWGKRHIPDGCSVKTDADETDAVMKRIIKVLRGKVVGHEGAVFFLSPTVQVGGL